MTASNSGFAELGLAPAVLSAINDVGYEVPSPIQAQAIPPLLAGRDLLGQAQTGTGKTAAFALPILSRIDLGSNRTQALVLTPTRELALQVAEAMQTYARHLQGFHVLPVYGGQGMVAQLRGLARGVHAVVGTPGRILDHLRRGTLDLGHLTTLVLDEADEMLRMGFLDDVREILSHTAEGTQIALFSATLPTAIRAVARERLRDPVEIRIGARTATVSTVSQRYWPVAGVEKLDALTRILEAEEFDAMLVFVRTKTATVELAEKLEARGFACAPLNGDMNQVLRERTVERLKRGALDIVVATDVAARGLDVDRISHVVNYDVPYDAEAYVHRIGRTARAGREGRAIIFVEYRERRILQAIERATRQQIERMQLPTREDVADLRIMQFKRGLAEILATTDLSRFERIVADFREEQDVELSRVAAALAYLAQRDRPLEPEVARSAAPRARTPAAPAKPPTAPAKRVESAAPRVRSEPPHAVDAEKRPARPSTGAAPAPGKRERPAVAAATAPGKTRYRVEVGRDHGLEVGQLVGAIANEAGLEGRQIGPIRIFATFSTVDLPEDLPPATREILRKTRVCQRALALSRFGDPHRMADKVSERHMSRKPRPTGRRSPPARPRRG